MARRKGISMMEFVMVASAATVISAVSFGALQNVSKAGKIQEAKGVLFKVRANIKLFRQRVGYYPTDGNAVHWSGYTYNYDTQTGIQAYLFGNAPQMIPPDPFKHVGSVLSGTAPDGAGGYYYDGNTGYFGINLLDSQYGTSGSIMTLPENPSTW